MMIYKSSAKTCFAEFQKGMAEYEQRMEWV